MGNIAEEWAAINAILPCKSKPTNCVFDNEGSTGKGEAMISRGLEAYGNALADRTSSTGRGFLQAVRATAVSASTITPRTRFS